MKTFKVVLPNGRCLRGSTFEKKGNTKNFVIQTGMNEHSGRYKDLAEFLNSHGFNVYVLDAFGQGCNAPTEDDLEKWPVDAFADNVEAMSIKVKELKERDGNCCLMGHSMGSFMTQSFVERFPCVADKVIIMGSNGPAKALYHAGYLLAKVLVTEKNWDEPSLKILDSGLDAYGKSVKDRKTELDWLSWNEDNVQRYIADPYCGHKNTNGFWREFMKGLDTLYRKEYLSGISENEKIFIIAGEDDPVGNCGKGPKKLEQMYKDLGVKDVTCKIYPKMRHEIINEDGKDEVYNDILNFIK